MKNSIELKYDNTTVGEWVFDEMPINFFPKRTAAGFCISIPSLLKLKPHKASPVLISNLRIKIKALDIQGLDLGDAICHDWYTCLTAESKHEVRLEWEGTISILQIYERIRDGDHVKFFFECFAESCRLIKYGPLPYRTPPERQYDNFQITYNRETWIHALNQLGAMTYVLVEFPLCSLPSEAWSTVWQAVSDARKYLEQGGTTGWKGCVDSVRLALQKWQEIEKEDMGPGWKSPSIEDREQRNKKQRLDNLRWHLLQCAHLGPHSHADDWKRDDAILLLATLCGLLAERNL